MTRCGDVVATIQNGVLVLQPRHAGELHTTVIMLADLERLMREDKEKRDPVLMSRHEP